MKRSTYKGIIVAQLLALVVSVALVVKGNMDYKEQLGIINSYEELVEKQKQDYKECDEGWRESYDKLQDKYGETIANNEKLKKSNKELKEKLNEVELKKYSFTREEINLLAKCVEAEAGNYKNHKNSQKYVCQVILNRLKSGKFPNTLKKVIYQKNGNIPQFSVAYNGAMNRKVSTETLANVYDVIVHGTSLPSYVLYFYSASVEENWVNTLNTYSVVEGTVFAYSSKK